MGVAYSRMAGSLQQSLNMMQQMNGARAPAAHLWAVRVPGERPGLTTQPCCAWAECMEHYMQSGLTCSLVVLPRSGGAPAAEGAGRRPHGGCGCVVKIVLKNNIKFPIANAAVVLTSSRPPADDTPGPNASDGRQQGRSPTLDCFRVTQHM